MDTLMTMLREHDSRYGPFAPKTETLSLQIEEELHDYRTKAFTNTIAGLISMKPTSEWGIRPSLRWIKRSVTRKQKRLLLQQMLDGRFLLDLSEALPEVEMFYWLSMYTLVFDILGESPTPWFLENKVERQQVGLGLLLMKYGNWNFREWRLSINWEENIRSSSLTGYRISTNDTYWSRNQNYFFGHWLKIQFEVVDDPNSPGEGIPYSSYCKGYGMDRGSKRSGVTPYSAELDGEEEVAQQMTLYEDQELATLFFLTEISTW